MRIGFGIAALGLVATATAQKVSPLPVSGAFPLVANGKAAAMWFAPGEAKVVSIAANLFADDVRRVTGRRPSFTTTPKNAALIVGTLGHSPLLDGLVKRGRLDVRRVAGRWEAYTIARVTDPASGLKDALVIAGADRRGTAYGLLSISEAIGVSPWHWWADVPTPHRQALYLSLRQPVVDAPAVKYRGIFINDEDFGLQPWAAKTFEPETGDIGPKTYAKVCELLLRLKANCLWPAMHPVTKAFNLYPQNKFVADDYGIVMGSSHAEPMLRNNVTEWDPKTRGEWNYVTNRERIDAYWDERAQANGRFENVYTVGMRGIHDSEMTGGGTMTERVARLERVIADQRAILARRVDPNVSKIPQALVPYKEVLPLYQNGLKVPDDVTLVWPDDNYGYIRQLSNDEERKRAGGAGVYYHLSYWGVPSDYLWLCTTPPALVWEEMRKAYDHGARNYWIVNVGDIKPGEIGLDFFMRLAWNPQGWGPDAQPRFLGEWAARTFGPSRSAEVAKILTEYYRLNFDAKPEFLDQGDVALQRLDDGDERLRRFAALGAQTERFYAGLPQESRDAAYELIVYPVRCAALQNVKMIQANLSRLYRSRGDAELAKAAGEKAQAAYEAIQAETRTYNETLAGGKWRRLMSARPNGSRALDVPDLKSSPRPLMEKAIGPRVLLEAEKPTRTLSRGGAAWTTIHDLGHSGDSIAVLPSTIPSIADLKRIRTLSPEADYEFTLDVNGPVEVWARCIPTYPIDSKRGLRYAVSIDDEDPTVVDMASKEYGPGWSFHVVRNVNVGRSKHRLKTVGKHTLRVWMVDPGVVIDRISVGQGDLSLGAFDNP